MDLILLLAFTLAFGDVMGFKHSEEDSCLDWWCYQPRKCGVSKWPSRCQACGGSSQSPINIMRRNLRYDASLGYIEYGEEYNLPELVFPVTNNGHTVVIDTSFESSELTISEGGLPAKYKLVQIHFHWGSHNGKGSEHRLNKWKFPGEIHFVHVKYGYNTIGEALGNPNDTSAIAVLGSFIVLGPHNDAYDAIVDILDSVRYPGNSSFVVLKENVASLLPRNHEDYFRYQGSLTTPPCSEVVIWTMLQNPVFLSSYQLGVFRSLVNSHGDALVNNYRSKKGVNGRIISTNYMDD